MAHASIKARLTIHSPIIEEPSGTCYGIESEWRFDPKIQVTTYLFANTFMLNVA
jgi:hypothetical protein